ncbi:MAG TPA: 5-formyltetrahydrofolate cyclo-ligase [Kiloniellales bacterium]|nr:5-formyltetrahydrofolate cyclo-ligase [Kiloniellales bacterium]
MSGARDPKEQGSYASPPCMMHEVDPAYMGLSGLESVDPQQRRDVMRWRKAERARLIKARLAIPGEERRAASQKIAARLLEEIDISSGLVVSAYWPFRGEPDLRDFMKEVVAGGGQMALPVVVEKSRPLVFRSWRPKDPLERGVWNIPVPAEGAAVVTPDVVISPVIGFDTRCYRLGYGGGYYDRTLAALPQKPQVIGVGFSLASIPTIFPLPHDIPMDCIITEEKTLLPEG